MKNTVHDTQGSVWWTVPSMAMPLLTVPLARASNFPPMSTPWLVVAMLAPLIGAQARRIWRGSNEEKRKMEEKFEREDAALRAAP
jgi:hypothetical protein